MDYDRLLELWEREIKDGETAYVPLVPLAPKRGALLFIGLNPSFNPDIVKRLLPDLRPAPKKYFAWGNRASFEPEKDLLLHRLAKEKHPYFNKFHQIAHALNVEWDHLDLFFWRETSQTLVRDRFLTDNSSDRLTRFARDQLALSMEMLEETVPIAVVIANALASDIFLAHRSLKFDANRGCYEDSFRGRSTPVFPASMLTGQRALDKHSLRRLVWHLGWVLKREVRLDVFDSVRSPRHDSPR